MGNIDRKLLFSYPKLLTVMQTDENTIRNCTSLLLVAIIILTQLLFGIGIRELFCIINK